MANGDTLAKLSNLKMRLETCERNQRPCCSDPARSMEAEHVMAVGPTASKVEAEHVMAVEPTATKLGTPVERHIALLNLEWAEMQALVKTFVTTGNDLLEKKAFERANAELNLLLNTIIQLFLSILVKSGTLPEPLYLDYCAISNIYVMLLSFEATGVYTMEMLHPLQKTLASVHTHSTIVIPSSDTLTVSNSTMLKQLVAIVTDGYEAAQFLLHSLQQKLDRISHSLQPVHHRLVEIKLELGCLIKNKQLSDAVSSVTIQLFQDELLEIDCIRIGGAFVSALDNQIAQGQAAVIDLIEACYEDVRELIASKEDDLDTDPIREIYQELSQLLRKLQQLDIDGTCNPEILERDLMPMQVELGKIDNLRMDGKFLNEKGDIPAGQAILHFMLHKCYRIVSRLQLKAEGLCSSPAINADLAPVFKNLTTLRSCFCLLVNWKVTLHKDEIIPYQMKLASIDNERVDGKFMGPNGNIPEGQAELHDLMAECFDLLSKLSASNE